MSEPVFDDEHDPHDFFGAQDDEFDDEPDEHDRVAPEVYRRRRRIVTSLALVIVLAVAAVVIVLVNHFSGSSSPKQVADFTGAGTGSAVVQVHSGDGAQAIGQDLVDQGVIASVGAFVTAATNDPRAAGIQPGSYNLPKHIPAKDALGYLLDGQHRARGLVIPEGATVVDVEKRLVAPRCTASSSSTAVCGLGVTSAAARRALNDIADLGLPTDYTATGDKTPISAEGFLYPLTYTFSTDTTPVAALQQMVSGFIDEVRSTGFTTQAKALHLTPYQALIIASIAQSEAFFAQDMPKVARVVLNRIDAGMPLQIDATSAYAFKLKGLDPTTQIYADAQGPYNTYNHTGLPPTPISNPGSDALTGAVHPAKGNWLYYVNEDKAGHLYFTNDEQKFEVAVAKCRANHWGCG